MTTELIDELPSTLPGSVSTWCCPGTAAPLSGRRYRTDLADRVDALVAAGERSMRALVDTVDTQRIVMPKQRALTNVNTTADLS